MSQAGSYGSGITPPPAGFVETLTGDIGGAVPPTAGNINVITGLALNNSGSTVDFTGSPGTSTLVLNVTDTDDNTLMGLSTGNLLLTTAFQNTAFGSEALTQITTQNNNTAVGFQALHAATSNLNTAVGSGSLVLLSTGSENTAIGSASGVLLSTDNRNTFLGTDAGGAYSTGSNNISIGYNVSGTGAESFATRIGIQGTQTTAYMAGISGVVVGNTNMVTIDTVTGQLGSQAISSGGVTEIDGDTGSATGPTITFTALGSTKAGVTTEFNATGSTVTFNVTDGNGNTVIGGGNTFNAGNANVGLGQAVLGNVSGDNNTGIGSAALFAVTSGGNNTGIGQHALYAGAGVGLATGSNNIAIGNIAGSAYLGAESNNIILGNNGIVGESDTIRIGLSTTSGIQITGANQSFLHNFGTQDTFCGINSGNFSTSGQNNSAFGNTTLTSVTNGGQNTAMGQGSLYQLQSGNNNSCYGLLSGSSYTSSESNNICIGANVIGSGGESNAIHIGSGSTTCFIAGIDGVNVGSTAKVVTEASNQLGTATITGGSGITITPTANTITIDSLMSYVTLVLTNAQIKSIHATPITLLAAPGAGKTYVLHKIDSQLNYGGNNAFTNAGSQSLQIFYASGTGTSAGIVLSSATITSTSINFTQNTPVTFNGVVSTNFVNQPLVITQTSATEIAGNAANDNTISVYVYYSILTL